MKKLKELVALITPNKTKSISIVGSTRGGNTKIEQLYRLISSEGISSDDEAFRKLYPKAKTKNSYYKLKHELREKLYNTAFFIDFDKTNYSEQQKSYVKCLWLTALGGILHGARAYSNAITVSKSALEISEKYEFTNEGISAARRIMIISRIRGTKKEVEEYSLKYAELVVLQQKEAFAEIYWAQLGLLFLKKKSFNLEGSYRADSYGYMLSQIPSSKRTLKLTYMETMIAAAKGMMSNNFAEAIEILEPALEEVANYSKYTTPAYTYGIAINLLACYIPLKRHAEARKVLDIIYENTIPATYNWYKSRELHFTLAMHTGHYAEAESLHLDTIGQKTFKKQQPFIQEAWTIYGAYLRILKNAQLLTTQEDTNTPFRIAKYLNNLPTFAKDKRGHNVPVLVSQIFLLLQQQKYDGLIERFEAINKYRERYVSREANFRSNVFLHMLREVTRNNFERAKVLAATADLRPRLDEEPIDVLSPGYDQEVLPYEDLWDILVECLE